MGAFVLVHGAGGGGWQWRAVERFLRAAGHDVFAPTLTGCGERSHLLWDEAIGLDVHVQDVVGVLEYEDLVGAVLVGHSYGGNVVTRVAHRVPERLSHVVYLDANVPAHGQSLVDLAYGPSPEGRARFVERARARGEQWRQRRPDGRDFPAAEAPPPADAYAVHVDRGLITERERTAFLEQLGPHPAKSYLDPVEATNPQADLLPRTYILCTGWQHPFAPFAERARSEPGWQYREVPSDHDAHLLMPAEVARLLLETL